MTENSNPAKRPADPERGNSLCAWLIDALAIIRVGWRAPHALPHHRIEMKPLAKLRRP
jgi:hypothetical protein